MRTRKKILAFFSLSMAAALAAALVFEFDVAYRNQGETITILRGQNALQIANDLKAEGYIGSKTSFLFWVVWGGNLKNLKSGVYDFRGLKIDEIIDRLVRARAVAKVVTVTPGQDSDDIASSLAKIGISRSDFLKTADDVSQFRDEFDFLNDTPGNAGLEGFFFPDSYQMPDNPSPAGVTRMMLENFGRKLTPELRGEIAKRKISIFDAVTMASMLEKEVITLEDKKIVAGILQKRLELGMPLQVDSTVLYGNNGVFDKGSASRYNTYAYAGMPPGPICNPGLDSLEAAVYPQKSDYLYYLSTKSGETVFSKTYGEHLISKAKYLD